jgi:hypothetical protein
MSLYLLKLSRRELLVLPGAASRLAAGDESFRIASRQRSGTQANTPELTIGTPNFGTLSSSSATGRQIQSGAKLYFRKDQICASSLGLPLFLCA